MRSLLTIVLWLALQPALAATVYKQVLPDGTVVYTDRPSPEAAEIELPSISTFESIPVPESGGDTEESDAVPAFAGYESFAIAQPGSNETLRDNGGNVTVALAIKPELQPGHRVDIRMDGRSLGIGGSTSLSLTNVDRGSHSLQAVIVDAQGKELARTGSVVFHLHRASALNPLRDKSTTAKP